jgi:acetyl esterase/lipase
VTIRKTDDTRPSGESGSVPAAERQAATVWTARVAAAAAVWLTGVGALCTLWVLLPAPNLLAWVVALLGREFSVHFAGAAVIGIGAAVVAGRNGARRTAAVALLLGLGTIGLASIPPIQAREDARRHGVELSVSEHLFSGASSTADIDPTTEVYARPDGQTLHADIYRPATQTEAAPAIVFVHGGAWRRGWRSMTPRWNEWLTGRGYVVVDIEYRLDPPPTWRDATGDVKCAVGWVRRHAERLDVDPERLLLMGSSAGGHLALLAAYTAHDDRLPPSCAVEDGAVSAVIAFYPPADLVHSHVLADVASPLDGRAILEHLTGGTPATAPEAYHLASPVTHVDGDVPPTFLVQGGRDRLQSPIDTVALAERLSDAGVTNRLLWLEHAGHAFDINWGGWWTQITRPALAEFLAANTPG